MDGSKFSKKIVPGIIILFWIIMMGILINKEFIQKTKSIDYQPFISRDTLLSDQWMGIYFNDSPVGFVHTSIEPHAITTGQTGYRIINRTWMNFLLLRKRNKVWFNAEAIVKENYQLQTFHFELNSGVHTLRVTGEVFENKVMELSIDSQGTISKKKIILPDEEGVVIANIISPFQSFGDLKVGKKYSLKVFNPFSLELEQLKIEVMGKDVIIFEDEEIETFVVSSHYRGLEQTAWINEKGEILKEETGLGWVLRKEDADTASAMYQNMEKTDLELAEMVSVNSNIALAPENITNLRVGLYGLPDDFDVSSQRQIILEKNKDTTLVEITKEEIEQKSVLFIPIQAELQFLEDTDFIQSKDKKISAIAERIAGNEKNSFKVAQKINAWVFQKIRKVPVVSVPSAVDVLKTKEGDCNEHTVLFAALARNLGIPTKINVGLAYTGGRFYYHAWPSVFVGQWVDMDPTFGQDIADAAHIKLIEGDINKQLDIIQLLGKLKLEVISYK